MRKYIFKFREDGKQKRKTINAADISEGLEKLFNGTSGNAIEDINVECKGEISNDKKTKE